MALTTLSLPDVHETVSRAVVMQAAKQVMEKTGIALDTPVYYRGKSGTVPTPGTQLGGDLTQSRKAIFDNRSTVNIDATEEYSMEDIRRIRSDKNDTVTVFHDTETRVFIRPIYITTNVTLSFKFETASESEARRWASELMVATDKGRIVVQHSFAYSYPIPDPALWLLAEVYKRREAVEGYGETFQEYFNRHCSPRIGLLGKRTDEDLQVFNLIFKERQSRVQGYFEFIGVPGEITRDSSSGTWGASFEYKFSYQRPEEILLDYPLVVHNQLMPAAATGEDLPEEQPDSYLTEYSNDMTPLSAFELGRSSSNRPSPLFTAIPTWDRYIITNVPQGTSTVLQALVTIDPLDKKSIINLQDLGDVGIDPDIMKFLVGEAPYLNQLYESFFGVDFYVEEELKPRTLFTTDESLMVKGKAPLSLRESLRARFFIVTDVKFLSWEAIARLRNYPKALVKVVAAINGYLRYNRDFIDLYWKAKIELWELEYVWWVLRGGRGLPSLPASSWEAFSRSVRKEDFVTPRQREQIRRDTMFDRAIGITEESRKIKYGTDGARTTIANSEAEFEALLSRRVPIMETVETGYIVARRSEDLGGQS